MSGSSGLVIGQVFTLDKIKGYHGEDIASLRLKEGNRLNVTYDLQANGAVQVLKVERG